MTELRTTPIQTRANKRLQQIADAAKVAIAESGTEHFTTSQVASIARCSVGVIYRYFEDALQLLEYVYPSVVETEEDIAALAEGSVLLCKVQEVFWLAPNQLERLWFAAGYGPEQAWTDAQVADWGPLRVLHRPGVERMVIASPAQERRA